MLDQLVESKDNSKQNSVRNGLLLITLILVFAGFVSGLGVSLWNSPIIVGGDGLELSTLVAPPIPDEAPPPPEPEEPKKVEKAANVDVRKEIIQNIMESPTKVTDIKTDKPVVKQRRLDVITIKGDADANTARADRPPPTKAEIEGATRGLAADEAPAKKPDPTPVKKAPPPPFMGRKDFLIPIPELKLTRNSQMEYGFLLALLNGIDKSP